MLNVRKMMPYGCDNIVDYINKHTEGLAYPDPNNPAFFISVHMQRMHESKHTSREKSTNGKVFEIIVLAAIIEMGYKEVIYQWGGNDIDVECDIAIIHKKRRVYISCKKSLRERRKIMGYEASIIKKEDKEAEFYGFIWREHCDYTPEKSIEFAHKAQEKTHYVDGIITVEDTNAINSLLKGIKKGLHGPKRQKQCVDSTSSEFICETKSDNSRCNIRERGFLEECKYKPRYITGFGQNNMP